MFRTCVISSAMQCHSFCCHLFSFSFSHRVFRVASNKYPVPMCALRSARLTLYRVPKLAVWSLRLSECYFSMSKSFQKMVGFRWKFFRAWSHTVCDYKLITDYLHSRQYISPCVWKDFFVIFLYLFFLSPILSLFHCMLFLCYAFGVPR